MESHTHDAGIVPDPIPLLLSIPTAAKLAGISRSELYRWVATGAPAGEAPAVHWQQAADAG